MKFDYILGNPPYNKGIVKKHHDTYYHPAMVQSKVGEVGFFLMCKERLLKPDGQLVFVTPGKFLTTPGMSAFRLWLTSHSVHIRCLGSGEDVFGGILVSEVAITHINRPVAGVYIEHEGYTYEWKPDVYPHGILPKFICTKTHVEYLAGLQRGTLDPNQSLQAGPNLPLQKVSDTPEGDCINPILTGRKIKYTNVKSATRDTWRVIIKKCFAFFYSWEILEPGIDHDYSYCGIVCTDEQEAKALLAYTQSEQFGRFWDSIRTSRHSYPTIRCIPKAPQ